MKRAINAIKRTTPLTIKVLFTVSLAAGLIILALSSIADYYKQETLSHKKRRIAFEAKTRAYKVIRERDKVAVANAIYVSENTVLTNGHVCELVMTDNIFVQGINNPQLYPVVKVYFESHGNDICLMLVTGLNNTSLPTLVVNRSVLIDSDRIAVAGFTYRAASNIMFYYARNFGAVLGELDYTAKEWDSSDVRQFYEEYLMPFNNTIMTDLPIIPGCSGSAIYNMDGELVGVASAMDKYYNLFIRPEVVAQFLYDLKAQVIIKE